VALSSAGAGVSCCARRPVLPVAGVLLHETAAPRDPGALRDGSLPLPQAACSAASAWFPGAEPKVASDK